MIAALAVYTPANPMLGAAPYRRAESLLRSINYVDA